MFLFNRLRIATIGSSPALEQPVTTATLSSGGKVPKPLVDDEGFPLVQPNGSLMLAWQVKNKQVLVVGGGNVAAGRILGLLNANAKITLVCPSSGLHPETAHYLKKHPESITYHDRDFIPSDVDDPSFVMALTAIDDPVESTTIWKLCKEKKIPVNVADVPPECDFYFGSVHRDGPLQIMVSTNGNGPRIAAMVRKKIAATLPENTGRAIVRVGELRKKLRKVAPGTEQGPKRMEWMSKVCDDWTLDQLCEMTDAEQEALLKSYEGNTVPTFDEVAKLAKLVESLEVGEREDDAREAATT